MTSRATTSRTTAFSLLFFLSAGSLLADWDEGVEAFNSGRYQDAASEFRAVVSASPDSPAGHYMLGLSLVRQKDIQAALASLAKAVEFGGDDPRYRLAFAQAQIAAKRSDDALATLSAQDPKAVPASGRDAYRQLVAKAATESKNTILALETLKKTIAHAPNAKTLWLALAHVAHKSDRNEEAFKALMSAYHLDQRDEELGRRAVHTAFAIAQKQSQGPRQSWYRKGFEAARIWSESSSTAEALVLAGQALMGAKDFENARSWFEKAASKDSGDPQTRYYLARCALALEEPQAALTHCQAAQERSPDPELTQKILETEGSAYRHLADFEKAKAAFAKAGNTEKVAEMKHLQELQAQNKLFEQERAECRRKVSEIEELKKDNEELKGTDVWRQLEADQQAILVACSSHLGEDG